MRSVTVFPLVKSKAPEYLTYFSKDDILPGTIVEVNLRKRKIKAFVLGSKDAIDEKSKIKRAPFALKKILKIVGPSFLNEAHVKSAEKVATHYLTTKAGIFSTFMPAVFLSNYNSYFFDQIKEDKLQNKNIVSEKLVFQHEYTDRISWYKTYIREAFARKEGVFIFVPTIRDVKVFYDSLSKGIEEYVISLTSAESVKETIKRVNAAITSDHPILIISTPQFISIPRPDIRTIIIEKEGSTAYQTMSAPFIDARKYLESYAEERCIKLILADTMLRIDTWKRVRDGELNEIMPLAFRTPKDINELVIKKNEKEKLFTVLKQELIDRIDEHARLKNKIFLFSLRNGLSTVTTCNDCKNILSCEYCRAPLVLYKHSLNRIFMCNKCGRHAPADNNCKSCGSWNLFPSGIGIESVSDECSKLFPKIPKYVIDSRIIKNNKDINKILDDWNKTGGILIGTEMASNAIVEKVPLIGIVSLDSLFNIPSYRVSERIVRLVTRLRELTEKTLVVQTNFGDDPILHITGRGQLSEWIDSELKDRKELNYLPYARLFKINFYGTKNNITEAKSYLEKTFEGFTFDIYKTPPNGIKKMERLTMILRVELDINGNENKDCEIAREKIKSLGSGFEVLVDPEDLL
jgi:primosomal protein N'